MIIKVCGMREPQNIAELERLGIDMMGFIFYPLSRRYAGDRPAINTAAGIRRVGVFVDESSKKMQEIAEEYRLEVLQLHGKESPQQCASLRAAGYAVIKAISVASAADLRAAQAYQSYADYLLFDTACSGYGGSGAQFNWEMLSHYRGELPFLLSGGIAPESADALKLIQHPRFSGIDINSRFEIAPAIKDIKAIQSFIQTIKPSIK